LFSVAIHGVEPSFTVPGIVPHVRPSFQDDFLQLHPKKTISELNDAGDVLYFLYRTLLFDHIEKIKLHDLAS